MKKDAAKQRIFTNIVVILLIALLSAVMIWQTISSAKENASQHMNTMADERAVMINDYVKNAENLLSVYANASETINIVTHPDSISAQAAAQAYTEKFSESIHNLEGVYVSNWDTKVYAHSIKKKAGITTREDEDYRKELQDALIEAGDEVYNIGIIESPASGKQIVSLYKALFDEKDNPVGIVGMGIYTEELVNSINELNINGIENAVYSMVNVNDYKYIFSDDTAQIGKEAENAKIRELCSQYKGKTENVSGSFEFKKNGKNYLSTYSYIADNGWILMVDDTTSEVFSFATKMTIYLSIFCIVTIAIIILFNIISKKQEETSLELVKTLEKNKKVKENLNDAVMHDIITGTDTRISFFTEYEKGKIPNSPENPYYFIMTNIRGFSDINIQFGNDAGDMVLVKTAEKIKSIFKDAHTYRTGSDEFITVDQSTSKELIMSEITKLNSELCTPAKIGGTAFTPQYGIAVVKKSNNISSSVTLSLKNILNNNKEQIVFVDLDEMSTTSLI